LAVLLLAGVADANPPPPTFCAAHPESCPQLTRTESARFKKVARTLERLLPKRAPYKRDVRRHGPSRSGYGRRGSAFPQTFFLHAVYFIDPDPRTFSEQASIVVTPRPVAASFSKGTVVADEPGWLVIEHKPGQRARPTMTWFEIVVGQRAGQDVPMSDPPAAPDPPGVLRSIHISVFGPHALARELYEALDAPSLIALVEPEP
jgi:hypothetical protein